jgi:ATP-dependent DNA helicase DinG
VLLGAAVPSRLLSAFPAQVPIERVPLDVAATRIRAFLAEAKGGDCPPAIGPLGNARGMGAVDPA